jgi:PDZ domain-containing secreted protein
MLSVKTLLVLTIITIIISSPYYIVAAGTLHKSSESVESSESHEAHQGHHGSQFTTSQPHVTTLDDVSGVMSVVTLSDVNAIIMSDMTEQCTV